MISRTLDTLFFYVTEFCLMAKALAAEALDNLVVGSLIILNSDNKVQNSRNCLQFRDVFFGFYNRDDP
jgi:hypothetical protein